MSEDLLQDRAPEGRRDSIFFGPEGLRAGWGLLVYVAMLAAFIFGGNAVAHKLRPVTGATHRAAGPHEQTPVSVLVTEGTSLAVVALATWIMARIERRPVGAYGLGGERRLAHFLAGLAWGVGFLSLLVLALKSAGLIVFDARLLFGVGVARYGGIWLAGFLLVGLFEEYLLRGYLQFTLARGLASFFPEEHARTLGFWGAAGLLSLLFGLGHGSNAGESPIGLLSAGLAGLVFCLSLWRSGSLWWAIGFHATWDWAQSFLYGVADSGTMVQFHLWRTHPVGRAVLSGGATGPEGSVLIVPVLGLVGVVIWLTLRRTHSRVLDS